MSCSTAATITHTTKCFRERATGIEPVDIAICAIRINHETSLSVAISAFFNNHKVSELLLFLGFCYHLVIIIHLFGYLPVDVHSHGIQVGIE